MLRGRLRAAAPVGRWGWSGTPSRGAEARPLCPEPWSGAAEALLPAVLAARHIWLLSTAASDHAQLWHQALPDSETKLELGELIPGEQDPGGRGQNGCGSLPGPFTSPQAYGGSLDRPPTPTQRGTIPQRPAAGRGSLRAWLCLGPDVLLCLCLPARSTTPSSGRGWMVPVCWPTSHLVTHTGCRAVWRR